MRECRTCEAEFYQRGGDPTLRGDECMRCELERLREEKAQLRGAVSLALEEVCCCGPLVILRQALEKTNDG